jgi:hypothetical protein
VKAGLGRGVGLHRAVEVEVIWVRLVKAATDDSASTRVWASAWLKAPSPGAFRPIAHQRRVATISSASGVVSGSPRSDSNQVSVPNRAAASAETIACCVRNGWSSCRWCQ